MILGSVSLIVITACFTIRDLAPDFFVQQGLSIAKSFNYSLVMALVRQSGRDRRFHRRLLGRKPTIIGASLLTILTGSIYPFIIHPPY